MLPSLRKKHPKARVTWITEKSAAPLLKNNPLIDRIWSPPERYLVNLLNERFDLVLNIDADSFSCHLTTVARAPKKLGFVAGKRGEPVSQNEAAEQWHQMGIWDHLKRANQQTYPAIIHQIAELPDSGSPPLLSLAEEEIAEAQQILARKGWKPSPGRLVLGINTGAGKRWPEKSLPMETLETVIRQLTKVRNLNPILLLGGPSERERNQYLTEKFGGHVLDTGNDNPVRLFAAFISQVNLMLTADTLAMHISLALRKYTIVHFGPTSAPEIELYRFGEKIIPEAESGSCYCSECPKTPKCNELIKPTTVVEAILRRIEVIQ
jgi:heptosyltransferase-2